MQSNTKSDNIHSQKLCTCCFKTIVLLHNVEFLTSTLKRWGQQYTKENLYAIGGVGVRCREIQVYHPKTLPADKTSLMNSASPPVASKA